MLDNTKTSNKPRREKIMAQGTLEFKLREQEALERHTICPRNLLVSPEVLSGKYGHTSALLC